MKYLRAIEDFIHKHFSPNYWQYLLDDEDNKAKSNKIKTN